MKKTRSTFKPGVPQPAPGEFNESTTPRWLSKATLNAIRLKPIRGSEFAVPSNLPPMIIGEHRLNAEQIAAVLLALQHVHTPLLYRRALFFSKRFESVAEFGKPDALLKGLKKAATAASLDDFAWTLMRKWLDASAIPKHKWALRAIGFLGSDAMVGKIAQLIREWLVQNHRQRAVIALECLMNIGTAKAIAKLNFFALQPLTVKGMTFWSLQDKADSMMKAIATKRGLSADQIEDRRVPDCDLDERGSRVFDFGPRQFRLVLRPGLRLAIKMPDGTVKDNLPNPRAKDDAAKADAAAAEWKLLKKEIKEVASFQAEEWERAMIFGRRWTVPEFESGLVKHSLNTILIRPLLWGGYDTKGKLAATFRVSEDRTYADAADNAFTLKGIDTVGIVHPLHLNETQKTAWGEVLSDHELIPPFRQLSRRVMRLEPDELKASEITRFQGIAIPAPTLIFGLERLGWSRVRVGHGIFEQHSNRVPGATAVVCYDMRVGFDYRDPKNSLMIQTCYFEKYSGHGFKVKQVPLKKVDHVAISEVLSDLSALAAKGK